jgi:DNA-binding response OmpR family regulator
MENKKAIIVFNDDDPVLARVARAKFQKATGWDFIITSDYQTALTEILATKPDLLITEIILKDGKGRNGIDLIKEVRGSESGSHFTIAVLSTLTQAEDKAKAMEAGADYYYVKSEISIQNFITELQNIFSKGKDTPAEPPSS